MKAAVSQSSSKAEEPSRRADWRTARASFHWRLRRWSMIRSTLAARLALAAVMRLAGRLGAAGRAGLRLFLVGKRDSPGSCARGVVTREVEAWAGRLGDGTAIL